MPTIHPGRFAARIEGPFVVFLIGFRINRFFAFNKWLPVAKAMGPMLSELYANPQLGFLGGHSSLLWPGVAMTQYWRSFNQLVDYAQSKTATHLPAWKAFNQSVGSDGTVGIWHETYQVAAGQYECVYANMPPFGLALVGDHEPATGHLRDARARMAPPPAE
jgi:Domain of unknown function (DUF4188)